MASFRTTRLVTASVLAAAACSVIPSTAPAAGHFNGSVDPAYVTEIYTGPLVGGPGMAWTTSGNMLTRNGSTILEYSPTQNGVHQGTAVHNSVASYPITGLDPGGVSMTNAPDGYIYAAGPSGLQRINPSNWAAPAVNLPGTVGGAGYGVNVLPNGKIVYSDGSGASGVYIYDPVATTNTLIYSAPFLIDDIETGPGGVIAVAGQSNSSIVIMSSTGSVINSFNTPHFPDGLAFGAGTYANSLYSNNNDGTVSRYDLSAGYLGAPTITDIASTLNNNRGYGDLAAVGPDCAFYITTFQNGGFHGCTPGVGTNWDNGTTNAEASVVRISLAPDGTGLPQGECGFYNVTEFFPEPGSASILAAGLAMLASRRRR